jgi:hypothetical protein
MAASQQGHRTHRRRLGANDVEREPDQCETLLGKEIEVLQVVRWSHFLGQPAKVGSSMRMTDHEDAETVFV